MARVFRFIRSKFDWVVYCLFWRSFSRSLVKSPGVIYGMSLEFERLLKELSISEDDKQKIKDVYNKHHGITEGEPMFEVLTSSDKKIPLDKYRDLMLAQFDLDDLIMSTTCYYLGRSTANVSWFCDSLTNARPNLRASTAKFVMQVVDEAFARYERGEKNALGHDCDREKWMEARKLWIGDAG